MGKSYQKKYRDNMTDEQKQRYRDKQKKYRDNMTDEQKQKRREANRRYKDNMSDERKQKLRDYQIDYQKKYYAAKKLNNNDNDNKIIGDNANDNKIIDDNDSDNDFYCNSIIIKLKNIVPIKDINSILKINKKAYLEGCNFINDSDNKND